MQQAPCSCPRCMTRSNAQMTSPPLGFKMDTAWQGELQRIIQTQIQQQSTDMWNQLYKQAQEQAVRIAVQQAQNPNLPFNPTPIEIPLAPISFTTKAPSPSTSASDQTDLREPRDRKYNSRRRRRRSR